MERKDAIYWLTNLIGNYSDYYDEALEMGIKALEQQKIGYWIPIHPLQNDDEGGYLCSNCKTGDWDIKPTDKFCKFCGAKMQGVKKNNV